MDDTIYNKTKDGQLAVTSTQSTTQIYTLANLQDNDALYKSQLNDEDIRHAGTISTIQGNIDANQVLITQATDLGVQQ